MTRDADDSLLSGDIDMMHLVGPTDAAWASGYMWRGALRGHPKPFVMFGVCQTIRIRDGDTRLIMDM